MTSQCAGHLAALASSFVAAIESERWDAKDRFLSALVLILKGVVIGIVILSKLPL